MSVPSRPVPRIDYDSEIDGNTEYGQCSDSSEGGPYYEEETHEEEEEEETFEEGEDEEEEEEGGVDYASEESSVDSSCPAEPQESSEEQARIQHRTCVVKEILSVNLSYIYIF